MLSCVDIHVCNTNNLVAGRYIGLTFIVQMEYLEKMSYSYVNIPNQHLEIPVFLKPISKLRDKILAIRLRRHILTPKYAQA